MYLFGECVIIFYEGRMYNNFYEGCRFVSNFRGLNGLVMWLPFLRLFGRYYVFPRLYRLSYLIDLIRNKSNIFANLAGIKKRGLNLYS